MVEVSRVGYTAGQEVEATSEKGEPEKEEPKGNTGVGVGTWEKDRKEPKGR